MAEINVNMGIAVDVPIKLDEAGIITPDILNDGNTVAWYRSNVINTITMIANRVSVWEDYIGSGRDLIQVVGVDQPLWSIDGVLFDGVSEVMKTAPFVYNQPEMIYMVFKQVTWTQNDRILDGNTDNDGAIFQSDATPKIQAFAGALGGENGNLAVNTFSIMRLLFNGASSSLQINETAAVLGNTGADNMSGFTLGANGSVTAQWSNIQVKEIILRNVADGASDQRDIYDYLESKYGL